MARRWLVRVPVAAALLAAVSVGAHAERPVQRGGRAQVVTDVRMTEGRWIDTTVRIERGGLVDLQLTAGQVIVTGWSRPEVRLRAMSQGGDVAVRATSSLASLSAMPGAGGRTEVHYEVSVPAGVRVLINATAGDVTGKDVKGDLDIRTVTGDIQLADIIGLVTAELLAGDFVGERLSGGARIDATAADVQITEASGDLDIDNTSGTTTLSGIRSSSVRATSMSGDVRFQGSIDRGGRYRFSSHSGTVRIAIPEGASALIELASYSGTVDSDLPITLQSRRGTPEKRFRLQLGDGGGRIEVDTFSGNIILRGPNRERED